MNSLLKFVVHKIWLIAVLSLIVVAVYVSLGRVMLPRLHQYQGELESYLSQQLGARLEMQHLEGDWQGFQPVVSLRQVRVQTSDQAPELALDKLVLSLDVFASVLQQQPVFSAIILEGLRLELVRDKQGRWQLVNAKSAEGGSGESKNLLGLLLAQGQIQIKDVQLSLQSSAENPKQLKQLKLPQLELHCVHSACASQGRINFDRDDQYLSFALNIINRPGDDDFQLDAYARWQPIEIDQWLPLTGAQLPVNLQVDSFRLGGQVWFSVRDGKLQDVRGAIEAPNLSLAPGGEVLAPVEELRSDFIWQREESPQRQSWSLALQDFTFRWRDEVFASEQQNWSFTNENGQRLLNLMADAVELEFFSNALLAVDQTPEKVKNLLASLRPRGRLINTHLQYRIAQEEAGSVPLFLLEANLDRVGVSPWKNAPGGDGVSGYLKVTPEGGLVDFSSDNFSLFFPKLYTNGWRYQHASGAVSWQAKGREFWLKGEDLKLAGDTGDIEGQFSLAMPRDGTEPRLDLLIGMRDAQVKPALTYVPDKRVSPKLVSWLQQAIEQGRVNDADFIYSGSAARGAKADTRSMRLEVFAEQVDLAYLPEWPKVRDAKAHVQVSEKMTHVEADAGRIFDIRIENLEAEYNARKGGNLRIKSQLAGPLNDGLRVLKETPVRGVLFDLIDDFQAKGSMTLGLELGVPLKGQSAIETGVVLETANGEFAIPSLDLSFDRIKGRFNYRYDKGLNAQAVTGRLFGEPFKAGFTSEVRSESEQLKQQTRIRLESAVTAEALHRWLQHPLFTRFEGKTDYMAELNFGAREGNGIVILSQLEGIEVNLPQPFAKSAPQSTPLTYVISLDEEPMHYLSYADRLQFALLYEAGGYQQGEIRIGGEPALFEEIPGIRFVGDASHLDIEEWQGLFAALSDPSATAKALPAGEEEQSAGAPGDSPQEAPFLDRLKQVRLKAETLTFAGQQLQQVLIDAEQINRDWLIQVENPTIKGQMIDYADTGKPMDIKLEYLRLPEGEDKDADPLVGVEPQSLGLINFSTDEFSIGDRNYGRWAFNIRPSDKGARVEQILLETRGLKIAGDLDWRYREGQHSSNFSGQVTTGNVGRALEAWDYSRSIEGDDGSASGALAWPGSPAMFSLLTSTGELTLKGKEGRFLEVEGSANVLRLFGIFNFSSLARRLRLDFSDLFKKGYSFDTLKGTLALKAGEVQITESLIIDGPSAKFKIDGRTDLINEQLDQELIVVLPVGDNIPIAATIVGAPQVGIPLYLLNKVFGDMFERFTSARYKVTGSWDDPKIELVKIFENRASEPQEAVETGEPAATNPKPGTAEAEKL